MLGPATGANGDLTNRRAAGSTSTAGHGERGPDGASWCVRQQELTVGQNPRSGWWSGAVTMAHALAEAPRASKRADGVAGVDGGRPLLHHARVVMRLYRGERVPWVPLAVGWLASMYIWAALTPAILWAGRRWPIDGDRRARWRNAAIHAGLSALVSAAARRSSKRRCWWRSARSAAAGSRRWRRPRVGAARLQLPRRRDPVLGHRRDSGHAPSAAGRAREREALELQVGRTELARQLTASQLSALKMQLQPHFLFNTLGAIMVLDPAGAGSARPRRCWRG